MKTEQKKEKASEESLGKESEKTKSNANSTYAIELPKGGGAIKGISEKFTANPVTGTASFNIPLPVSPARGFEPQLGISYDSGNGNSAFGLGWVMGIPSIGRKTEKGLPQYLDANDSDTYTLDGAEDLIPLLKENNGTWQRVSAEKALAGIHWEVTLYRPRIENGFAKIERLRNLTSGIIWWRTTSGSNITSIYGYSESARIADPSNPVKIFKWLIECSYDDKGNLPNICIKQKISPMSTMSLVSKSIV